MDFNFWLKTTGLSSKVPKLRRQVGALQVRLRQQVDSIAVRHCCVFNMVICRKLEVAINVPVRQVPWPHKNGGCHLKSIHMAPPYMDAG